MFGQTRTTLSQMVDLEDMHRPMAKEVSKLNPTHSSQHKTKKL